MFFIGFWFLMAIVLYFMRPKRNLPQGKGHDGVVSTIQLFMSIQTIGLNNLIYNINGLMAWDDFTFCFIVPGTKPRSTRTHGLITPQSNLRKIAKLNVNQPIMINLHQVNPYTPLCYELQNNWNYKLAIDSWNILTTIL